MGAGAVSVDSKDAFMNLSGAGAVSVSVSVDSKDT